MDRGLKAAFLFSLVVVAQADRALTAHKPATGGLHAVALLRSTAGATTATTLALEYTIDAGSSANVGNYMITNGNGTWTYSYYAANGHINGNDAGMGGDYEFTPQNPAWFNSNAAIGGALGAISPFAIPSQDDPAAVGSNTQIQSPVFLYSLGLSSMVFTGSKTGIAVGRFGGFHDYDQTFFVSPVLATDTTFVRGNSKLNILMTYDGATTWVRATGLPKLSGLGVSAVALTAPILGGVVAPIAVANGPYPTTSVGDLTSIFMASKTLGWAVGGNDVSYAVSTSSDAVLGNLATNSVASPAAVGVAGAVSLGLVLMTQNGGSLWKTVPIYISYASLAPIWSLNDPSIKTIYDTPIPGILFSIQSDASGKHVYTVGSPSSKYYTATYATLKTNADVATEVQVKPYGTILYSGNSGMSWVQQTAPTLYSGKVDYTLFSVAVQKGTTAIAVGGAAGIKYGDKSAGTIIYTMNGGFSWTQAVYPSSTGTKAPVFTCVSLQPAVAGVQTVWVGGFTTRSDAATAAGKVVKVNGGAQVDVGAGDFFPVAAVAGYNPGAATNTVVSAGVQRAKGQIYTILVSKDGGKTFAAAPTAGLPTGFVVTSFTHITGNSLATDRSVYGITWDNAMHGWIFGYGFIMSTQNGGATWVYETPADVGVLEMSPFVTAIASVPTTY